MFGGLLRFFLFGSGGGGVGPTVPAGTISPYETQPYIPWPEPVAVGTPGNPNWLTGIPAGCYRRGTAEAQPTGGAYTRTLATFTFSQTDVYAAPQVGGSVTWNGDRYTITDVSGSDWLRFWAVDGVSLRLNPALATTCQFLRPASESVEGLRRANLTSLAAGIPCAFQPDDMTPEADAAGKLLTRQTNLLFFVGQYALRAGDIARVAGVDYEVVATADLNRLDALPSARLERIA